MSESTGWNYKFREKTTLCCAVGGSRIPLITLSLRMSVCCITNFSVTIAKTVLKDTVPFSTTKREESSARTAGPDLLIKFLLRRFNCRVLIGRLDGYAKSDFDGNSCESQFAIEAPIARTASGCKRG